MLKPSDIDISQEKAELREKWKQLTGVYPLPSYPEDNILDLVLYRDLILIGYINERFLSQFLPYAKGEDLDKLAEFYGVKRLPPRPAITTLRFTLSKPITIPKGTKVASKTGVIFETIQEVSGDTQVEVQAFCTQAGSIGNGFLPGEISILLDPIEGVLKVENITISTGGADTEDDDRFMERIRLSLERFTNAGSKEAYVYHTKTAHQDIEDVSVFSPSPGVVKVVFLLRNGQLPDAQMIELVRKHLSDEKVRPLTDQVIVEAPQVVNYDISLTYYIHRKDETLVSQIQEKVNKAVQDFINWTKSKIGRDILPEELVKRVKEAGAYRVELQSPQYIQVNQDQVAVAQTVNVQYGGLVDD